MTAIDLTQSYIILSPEGEIIGADTDLDDALDVAWSKGLGFTAVPLSRIVVASLNIREKSNVLHNKLKELVAAEISSGFGSAAYSPTSLSEKKFEDLLNRLRPLLASSQKIQAIKETRTETQLGLGTAKAFVDWLWEQVGW